MGLTHFGFGYEGNCVVPFYDSVVYLCDTKVENDWQTIEFVYENNYVFILLVHNVAWIYTQSLS